MDFSLTAEQIRFKESVVEFARRALKNEALEHGDPREFYWEGWRRCAEFGIQGIAMPKAYGGLELDLLTCVLIMQGLGYACRDAGLIFSLNTQIWTCECPILKFGTDEQKEKYLGRLISGSIVGGHAMTEPDSGSDAFSMKTRAVRDGDRYILNGTKIFITNAPIADILLVFAVTNEQKKFGGVSAFIVEKGFPGFSVGKPFSLMGLRSCPIGEVILQDCEVPAENRLGSEGAGSAIFNSEMEQERSCLFASQLGAMEKILEDCVQYAKARSQFGQPIGDYQAVSHKIADMRVRIELSRLILYQVAWMKASGKRAPVESSIAKLYVSESYVQTCMDALQIHGAYGYSTEFPIERNLRDSIAGKIYSGSSEIQRNILASFLGL
ncbi:acyl-CoA dehydrogenase family protein [Syntrophus aciditrophicus]|uniref:Acyl-CoA dehydrogenase n=1 Tax=Syntrophus aciditrophicus (strain SB) TaxID=56780 RepID=Q2LPR7_SYNAS|nr:acyl-CoA dehydrogenase family protein [Syntrophus aciditrophicus]ABC76260.1 acyl-CoA dehydrogenase [Syntrophus aciditrophicus SB]OPY17388.1 MAG: Acyl-CoA dehydrogenase [Syntrophus sp. PtaB.Bin075]